MTMIYVKECAIVRSRVVVDIRPLKHLKTLYGYHSFLILLRSSLKSAFTAGILDILVEDNFRTTRDGTV